MSTQTQSTIVDYLVNELEEVIAIFIFGSYIKDRQTSNSDIDIAFLCREEVNYKEKSRISVELQDLLKNDIDLVDMRAVSPILVFQILSEGEQIYKNNNGEYNTFVMKSLGEYYDVKKARKPIEENLAKGSIYE